MNRARKRIVGAVKGRRDKYKEAAWQHQVDQWKLSGMSARKFCAVRGINESNFHSWRRELRRREAEKTEVIAPPIPVETTPAFTSIRLVDDALAKELVAKVSSELKIQIGKGVTLSIDERTDLRLVRRLIMALEANQ